MIPGIGQDEAERFVLACVSSFAVTPAMNPMMIVQMIPTLLSRRLFQRNCWRSLNRYVSDDHIGLVRNATGQAPAGRRPRRGYE
jgi:hypothetical protein